MAGGSVKRTAQSEGHSGKSHSSMKTHARTGWLFTSRPHSSLNFILAGLFTCSAAFATPRPPLPALPHAATTLFHTRFDEAYWFGHERASFVTTDYGTLVERFSGYALQRTGKGVVPFVVPALDATGRLSVATDAGAFGFWFKPDWTSAAASGVGPGYAARLAEMVAVGDKQAAVGWSLQTSGDGSVLLLVGAARGNLTAAIAWSVKGAVQP